MNLLEYQGKELFARAGIPVPKGRHVGTASEAREFVKEHPGRWVVKAQVLIGGRGKAGGIQFAATPDEAQSVAEQILGMTIANRQNPKGEIVRSLLIEEQLKIAKEAYCAVAIDRATRRPIAIASRRGGMDIEEVAEHDPADITKFDIDAAIGYSPFIGRDVAFEAKLDPGYRKAFPAVLAGVYDVFFRYGAKLVEINPLVLTEDGLVFASDAKVELDDDALYKNSELKEWQKSLPLDEDEALAVAAGLGIRNFRRFEGTVGTMANGAGLAMATMDAVRNGCVQFS